jgi:hypothetical protein
MNRTMAGVAALSMAGFGYIAVEPKPAPYTPAFETVVATYTDVPLDETVGGVAAEANCPTGKVPSGGGYGKLYYTVGGTYPAGASYPTATGWRVEWHIGYSTNVFATVTVYVRCANP